MSYERDIVHSSADLYPGIRYIPDVRDARGYPSEGLHNHSLLHVGIGTYGTYAANQLRMHRVQHPFKSTYMIQRPTQCIARQLQPPFLS